MIHLLALRRCERPVNQFDCGSPGGNAANLIVPKGIKNMDASLGGNVDVIGGVITQNPIGHRSVEFVADDAVGNSQSGIGSIRDDGKRAHPESRAGKSSPIIHPLPDSVAGNSLC